MPQLVREPTFSGQTHVHVRERRHELRLWHSVKKHEYKSWASTQLGGSLNWVCGHQTLKPCSHLRGKLTVLIECGSVWANPEASCVFQNTGEAAHCTQV